MLGYNGPVPNVTINTNVSTQAAAAETGNLNPKP